MEIGESRVVNYKFKNINAVLGNNWTYQETGNKKQKDEYIQLARMIKNIVCNYDTPDVDFV